MRYRFYTTDVFTDKRFGGNQLAVLPDASGLSDELMQSIAAEFNFSESTFVFPSDDPSHTRKVRIFTPRAELPFAGHPNIGTAFVLAATGELGGSSDRVEVTFEEKAGVVPVSIRFSDGRPTSCELTAPQNLALGDSLPVEGVAEAISLRPDDIVTSAHMPQIATVGLNFLCTELRSLKALADATIHPERFDALIDPDQAVGVHIYTRDTGDDNLDIRARMYAPHQGVREDPATGSANCVLAGLLTNCETEADGAFTWRIAQGVEMGRPSLLIATAEKSKGAVTTIRIGGSSVLVSEGWIDVG